MHDLPFQTPTQFAALALTLIAGWLLGLGSSSGGAKWRERYEDEAGDHAGYRHQAETDLKEANRRIRDLEAECGRLKTEATAAAAAVPVAAVAASDEPAGSGWRGWFGWGRDNLSRIRGIDEAREKRLNELGIKTYREIEKMTADDEAALEQRLEMEPGSIAGEEWREQAALLRAGNEDEHAKRFA
jgi:predicted flap endonuclease-1-like 5' DNA nuclease